MSVRLRLALSHALLCGVLLPATCLTATPAAAQKQLAPDNSVMTYRLPGTWQIRETEYIFEPPSGGLMGKAPGANLFYREIDRKTGKEQWRGALTPYVREGVMRGEVKSPTDDGSTYPRKQIRAWVDDRGRLWMDNYNATSDGQTYARVSPRLSQESLAAWRGKWRTSRGILEVREEGANFVGWILADDGSTRERVAFKADAKQAVGAWDSEYDAQGAWRKQLVGYGDLNFTLSADGKAFTGWYSTPTGTMGLERREWTGQRIGHTEPSPTPQTPPSELDETANRLLGTWYTPFGPIEMTRRVISGVTVVATEVPGTGGLSHLLNYGPGSGSLIHVRSGSDPQNRPMPFTIAADGSSFQVEGTGSGIRGAWTATRREAQQVRSQPTAEQATLLRVLEGRWREQGGDALWRFPVPTQNGAVSAATWRSQDGEAAAKPAPFGPAQDGRTLVGKLSNGARVLIERNTLGEVHLIRPAQGGSPFWSTELIKANDAPADPTPSPSPSPAPTTPAPAPRPSPAPGPSQPAPAGFKPLNRVDVRVDRVIVARGYPTHQVHAFVTVKNTSATPQYFTSGFLKAVLADGDGVSWERSQPYRASGEPAELFGSTPVIQPGGELKVRYVFLSEVDARLTSLTLSEGAKRAEFSVGGL